MILYYHPILGLQYRTLIEEVFEITFLPDNIKEINTKELLDMIKKIGILPINSASKVEQLSFPIYSNF